MRGFWKSTQVWEPWWPRCLLPQPGERRSLLRTELEQLVVEAKKLGMKLTDVEEALADHWKRLDAPGERNKP